MDEACYSSVTCLFVHPTLNGWRQETLNLEPNNPHSCELVGRPYAGPDQGWGRSALGPP